MSKPFKPKMRGGEHASLGALNTEYFRDLVSVFGWEHRVPPDRNFPCAVCSHGKKEEKGHGVDLLFTIKCPYSQRLRGIYVDGKRVKQENMTSKEAFKKWIDGSKKVAKHLDQSQHLFRDHLGFPIDFRIDTAIVAWDAGEWDEEKGVEFLRRVSLGGSDEPPIQTLLFTKPKLDRIATIFNWREKCDELNFYYFPSDVATWGPTLTPELIASNWWPIEYRRKNVEEGVVALFCFDLQKPGDLEMIPSILSNSQFTTHRTIEVHFSVPREEFTEFSAYLESVSKRRSLKTKLVAKQLIFTPYRT